MEAPMEAPHSAVDEDDLADENVATVAASVAAEAARWGQSAGKTSVHVMLATRVSAML